MNSKKYLVKLTPHHQFFFGGEATFGEASFGDGSEQVNYLVKSNDMPQQTGLLGLIRHQLLLQNDLLDNGNITNRKQASALIGPKSFRDGEADLSFGAIKKISPLMIVGVEGYYFPLNREYQIDKKTKKRTLRKFELKDGLPLLNGFDPKENLLNTLVNQDLSDFQPYEYNEDKKEGLFSAKQQVGIRKNYQGVTDEKAYYLQTFKKLAAGYSFGFMLELADQYKWSDTKEQVKFQSSDVVIFGGEQCAFKMEVEETKQSFEELVPNYLANEHFNKIVLLSDTKLTDNQLFDHLVFSISETSDFRFLQTSVEETKNYAALSKDRNKGKLTKSKRFKLLKKGSVLYYEQSNHEKVIASLDDPVFQMIGYNHYKVIKPNSYTEQ